jgi:hypothetical protein
MMITDFFTNAGLFSKVATVIGVVPLALGVVYAVWPTEERLALMRPLSLATIFAAISGMVVGVLNALLWAANQDPGAFTRIAAIGVSEALVPVFFGFGCLTVAWLCVAVGLWRRP